MTISRLRNSIMKISVECVHLPWDFNISIGINTHVQYTTEIRCNAVILSLFSLYGGSTVVNVTVFHGAVIFSSSADRFLCFSIFSINYLITFTQYYLI